MNYFIYLDEDMNDIIKIIKPLEDSNVLIDGITETVKAQSRLVNEILSNLNIAQKMERN